MNAYLLLALILPLVVSQTSAAADAPTGEADRLAHYFQLLSAGKHAHIEEETAALLAKGDLDPYVGRYYVRACLALQKPDHALAVVKGLEKEFPKSGVPPFLHGYVLSLQNDFHEADAFYRKALELEPDLPCVWFGLGFHALERGVYDEAEAAFGREIEKHPGSEREWACRLGLGRVRLAKGEPKEALAELGRAREALPPYPTATENDDLVRWYVALAYRDLGEIEKEIAEFGAIKSWPDRTALEIAYAYLRLGDFDKLEEVCRELNASESEAGQAMGHVYKALVLSSQRKYKKSSAETERAMEFLPKYPSLLARASTLEREHGSLAHASSYAFEYIKAYAEEKTGWDLYVAAMNAQGGAPKAIEFLSSMRILYPKSTWRLFHLVHLTKLVGDEAKAIRYLEVLRKLDADFAEKHFPAETGDAPDDS